MAESSEKPGLSGKDLYREILLRNPGLDAERADKIMQRAEASLDEWTDRCDRGLTFRQIVHYFVLTEYLRAGHQGVVVDVQKIVAKIIPPEL